MSNIAAWESADLVEEYAQRVDLQPPERTILASLTHLLPELRMLDLGVGGGRTTVHFAPYVKAYVGIDRSAPMIKACRSRFRGQFATARFEVCDACDLGVFDDNSFDFVLFSFNGIDYVSPDSRLDIFREVHRVGRPGALFCFSSHNILNVDRLNPFRFRLHRNPIRTFRLVFGWLRWRILFRSKLNLDELRAARYTVINDGAYGCRMETY